MAKKILFPGIRCVWRVREMCEERGLTFDDFMHGARLTPKSANLIWSGQSKQVQLDTLARVAKFCKVKRISDFLELVPEDEEAPSSR